MFRKLVILYGVNIDNLNELDFELSHSDNVFKFVDENFYSKGYTCRKLSVYIIFVLLEIGFYPLDILLIDCCIYEDKYLSYYDLRLFGYSKEEIYTIFYLINPKKIHTLFIEDSNNSVVLSNCSICLENLCADTKKVHLPCGHFYHDECIFEWWKIKFTCPLCRYCLYPKMIKEWIEENTDFAIYLEIIQQQCKGNVDLRQF